MPPSRALLMFKPSQLLTTIQSTSSFLLLPRSFCPSGKSQRSLAVPNKHIHTSVRSVLLPMMPLASYTSRRQKGHSKWQNIAHRKSSQDKIKSSKTANIVRQVQSALRGGTDPKLNSQLAHVIEMAMKSNIPKSVIDNHIQKAIERKNRCTEFSLGIQGPHDLLIILTGLGISKHSFREAVKNCVKKTGILTEVSTVSHSFTLKGYNVIIMPENKDIEEIAITCDAEDFSIEEEDEATMVKFACDGNDVMKVKKNLEEEGYKVVKFGTEHIPNTLLELSDEEMQDVEHLLKRVESFEDLIDYSVNI